jgi:Domain of Unknown Function (DUF928)
MKRTTLVSLAVLTAFAVAMSVAPSAGQQPQTPPPPRPTETRPAPSMTAPATTPPAPVYKPPLVGAPGGRVGGGTRGTGREVFVLSVLAPDHTGLTINEQPTLYWFISASASSPVALTVVDPRATRPVLEVTVPAPVRPGVHLIRLADHAVKLASGVAYRWYVAVVPDPDRRSKDILAGGTIERVERPAGLDAKLTQTAKAQLPAIYGEAGLWYDAVQAISELIDATPNDPGLRKQRSAMLVQVGLPDVGD